MVGGVNSVCVCVQGGDVLCDIVRVEIVYWEWFDTCLKSIKQVV